MTQELLRVAALAKELGIKPASIYRYIAAGKLAVVRLGPKTIRITREDWAACVRRHRQEATPKPARPPMHYGSVAKKARAADVSDLPGHDTFTH